MNGRRIRGAASLGVLLGGILGAGIEPHSMLFLALSVAVGALVGALVMTLRIAVSRPKLVRSVTPNHSHCTIIERGPA